MLNKVMLIGHLGRDPELKYGQSGNPVCTMTVATDEGYVDKEGNKVERVEWHRIVAYQRLAETCGQYLQKGRLVYVEGKLQTRKWQDKDGRDQYTTEIVAQEFQMLDRASGESPQRQGGGFGDYNGRQGGGYAQAPQQPPAANPSYPPSGGGGSGMHIDFDDDIPF